MFPVRGRDLVRQGEDEAPVLIEFLGGRLAPDHSHRVAEVVEPVLPELFGGVVSGVVHLGLGRHDLVEEFPFAVLVARFGVGLGHRDRLAERSAAGRRYDDHPGGRRSLENHFPFLR